MATPAFKSFDPPRQRIALECGGYRAEIWPELGGSVASFEQRLNGGEPKQLFRRTQEQPSYEPYDLACWALVPYGNRIKNGRFAFAGKTYQLPANYEGLTHPLHGLGWLRPWNVVEQSAQHCRIQLVHRTNAAWPFAFTVSQLFKLTAAGLEIGLTLTNDGPDPMPYGLGQHPYIHRPQGTRVQAQVEGVWLTDEHLLPTTHAQLPPQWDLRTGFELDGAFMDNCFDGLKGDATVLWPDGSRLVIGSSDNMGFLVVYNEPEENFVCIEPVSHMTDAINFAAHGRADTGLKILAPGASVTATHCFASQPSPTG
ncbi:MAG TPA: aldose 1-epimerase [Steroidobacteraceae bacterium]|nr:aldose 1-epimerase [Steroidobacteraceae bacterium]